MSMKSKVLIAVLLLCSIIPVASATEDPIRIGVTALYENDKPTLQITFTNTSSSVISMYQTNLPWGWRNSLYVHAFTRKRWIPLDPVFPPGEIPPATTITIQPGKTLRGSIDLTFYLGLITKYTKEDDLVVFWFYKPRTTDEKSLGEYGNWLVLPRTTSTSPAK